MSFYKMTELTSRKEHFCKWCHGKINSKERYCNHAGTFDGEFFSYKTHVKCKENMDEAFSLYRHDCFDVTLGYLKERALDENPELVAQVLK